MHSVGLQAFAAIMMVLFSTFESLLYYIGFSLIFFTGLSTAGLIKLRRRRDWRPTRALSRAYPAIPVAFILVTAWMLTYSLFARPTEALMGVATIATGGVAYHLWGRGTQ